MTALTVLKFNIVITLVILSWLTVWPPLKVLAQAPDQCEVEYTVQSGDWLSKIAEKYYGDPLAFNQIVETANASGSDAYIDIANPNLIEPGWVLCLPAADVIAQLVHSQVVGAAESGSPTGAAITPSQISLDTQGLPYSWQPVVIPETPYDASRPPGPVGLPEHIDILFGVTNPADRQPADPIMYLIPVNAYRQMWDQAGNSAVSKTIEQIEQVSFSLPNPAPTSGLPALPYEGIGAGFNDLAVQVGRAVPGGQLNETSATQTGYRFVGRWAQDANPVTNQGLRYVYQGFTNDGQYLVSFWFPVSTSALPNDVSAVPAEQMAAFNANPSTYITATADTLNHLSPDQWQPSLTTLDAVVASLQIQGMTVAGLQDKTWLWTEGPMQPGSAEKVVIPNPEQYQVTYGTDGVINFVADCNPGSMPYELRYGGMAGGMLAMSGPMTLAECGPDSLYTGFVNSLSAAQNYRIRAGGNPLELILPAGGGTLILTNQGAPLPVK